MNHPLRVLSRDPLPVHCNPLDLTNKSENMFCGTPSLAISPPCIFASFSSSDLKEICMMEAKSRACRRMFKDAQNLSIPSNFLRESVEEGHVLRSSRHKGWLESIFLCHRFIWAELQMGPLDLVIGSS